MTKHTRNKKINVCDDLISNPTFCNDLSDIIMDGIILNIEGVYNYGSNKFISKYDFAKYIASLLNKDINLITRIKTSDAKFIAKRPLNTSLICDKIVNESSDCDVFINNAYHEYAQVDLLYRIWVKWKDQRKQIVCISSVAGDIR